eukprot:TRINITY_DN45414_c0_g1_i1.p1 TRINITY_DN45414_c0_g1~~TRINITY_DN45414_c0_g1_i1.p1  ORF type:complete len:758 (+),score=88.11 TRINITY_DN45414_c0_g1_i1:60-2333(+)
MAKSLRFACLGDSWVACWTEDADGVPKKIVAPMPAALQAGLEARGQSLELLVAGFPGATTERLLDLVKICRLRDMVPMSSCGHSIKDDLVSRLEFRNVCFAAAANERLAEDVDVVLVAVGSNDLCYESLRQQVIGRLFLLRQIYVERGVEVILVSLGGVQPGGAKDRYEIDMEANRACVNARLLKEDWVLNFDDLMAGLGASLWLDSWHLTVEGCQTYGERLAEAISVYLCKQRMERIETPRALSYREEDLVRVSRCTDATVSDVIEGVYFWEGVNHGRPVYKRLSKGGTADVVIFFWDDRNGPTHAGWWFGPEIGWSHAGWAHYGGTMGSIPPTSGWKVPPDGVVDEKLKVAAGNRSDLECLVASLASETSLGLNASSCRDPLISNIITGRYAVRGVNHGKPIYKKVGGDSTTEVRIFFWDTRHGADWSGWWISPKVGDWTHAGWARHRDVLAGMPPTHGWHIPPYGEVDESFRLIHLDEVCPDPQASSVESPVPLANCECDATPQVLHVAACKDDVVSAKISGHYCLDGDNHGKPVYKKQKIGGDDEIVQIFFWDARDGPQYAGWWFGPLSGNWYRSGLPHHEDGLSFLPPRFGWQVPLHGPVDEKLQVVASALPAPSAIVTGQMSDESLGDARCENPGSGDTTLPAVTAPESSPHLERPPHGSLENGSKTVISSSDTNLHSATAAQSSPNLERPPHGASDNGSKNDISSSSIDTNATAPQSSTDLECLTHGASENGSKTDNGVSEPPEKLRKTA